MPTNESVSPPPPGVTEHTRRRGMLFLGLAVACVSFTLMLQMGLNDNFLFGDIGVNYQQKGQIESARETCGIIALGVLAVLSGFAEPLVGAAMLLLVAAGLSSYAFVPQNYLWVLGMSMIWSQGLHVWMPLPNSMALGLAEPGKAGYRLGQLSAAGAAGSFAALGVAIGSCLFCTHVFHWGDYVPIRPLYIVAGAVAVLGSIACLRIPRHIKTPGPRLVFRAKYKLYYLLCLLEGWRKQVFLAFAGIFLVKQFDTSLMVMLILWSIIQMVGYISSPIVGRIIDRVGERRVLLFYYVAMISIFGGYVMGAVWGPAHPWMKYLLYVLFVMDGSFFVLAMSLTTYVNRIAPQSEHTATLSMGVAMNHVSAVTMPLVGGMLSKIDIKWTFLLGASAGILSILASLRMPKHGVPPQGPPDDELTPSHAGVAAREEV